MHGWLDIGFKIIVIAINTVYPSLQFVIGEERVPGCLGAGEVADQNVEFVGLVYNNGMLRK